MKWGWGAAKGFVLIVVMPIFHIIGVGHFNADIGEGKVFRLLAIDFEYLKCF